MARDAQRYTEAAKLYLRVLRLQPGNAAIHIQCGHMLKEAGDLPAAESHYLMANKLIPDDPDLALQLGHYYKLVNRLAESEQSYRKALALWPSWEEPRRELNDLYARGVVNVPNEFAIIKDQLTALSGGGVNVPNEFAIIKDQLTALSREVGEARSLLQRFVPDGPEKVARQLAEVWGYRGNHDGHLYRAFAGTEDPAVSLPAQVPLTSTLCHQYHFMLDQYRFWMRAMKDRPWFHRKQWELFFIAQALYERGYLAQGKRGVGFGVGQEPLPALFASLGCEVVATDQRIEAASAVGWAPSVNSYRDPSPLNRHGICTDRMFGELVSFEPVDMNDLPRSMDEQFDFTWSACSLEHLGSLKHGLDFIESSLRVLKPGGIAVHTTEFNLSSNTDTIESTHLSLYRRCDIDGFMAMMTAKGFRVSPIDWTLGEGFAEIVVDLPPHGRGEPHLRLRFGEYDVTSIGLIIEKK
jgi:tetratricopeptide (TPR) repeat protein